MKKGHLTSVEVAERSAEQITSGVRILKKEMKNANKGFHNNHIILTLENGIKTALKRVGTELFS